MSLGVPVTSRNRLGGSIDSPIGYRASCPTNGERLSIGRLVLIVRMEPSDYEGLIGHADPTPVGTAVILQEGSYRAGHELYSRMQQVVHAWLGLDSLDGAF